MPFNNVLIAYIYGILNSTRYTKCIDIRGPSTHPKKKKNIMALDFTIVAH